MTSNQLTDYVWEQLGPRKHLAGRQRVAELVEMAVRTWPAEVLGECRDEAEQQIVTDATVANMRRRIRERQYGMIWTLLLTALASAVFQVILKWWLDRRSNRVLMLVMRQEAAR
jgi:hypothetical protein